MLSIVSILKEKRNATITSSPWKHTMLYKPIVLMMFSLKHYVSVKLQQIEPIYRLRSLASTRGGQVVFEQTVGSICIEVDI